ncbi:MAG: amino acid adenylation domain-containing protein, partial [Cyclobacteriaceae bacterium]
MQSYTPTVSQKLILMDQMVTPDSAKYNIGGYAILKGDVSITTYKQAVKDFISSQEVFSTLFKESNGNFEAVIQSDNCKGYDMETLDYIDKENSSEAAISWMENEFSKPFNVASGPLFKFCLIRISEETSYWFANVHHLIADGWSFMLLLNGIAENYSRIKNNEPSKEAPLPYSEYAKDDEEYYSSDTCQKDRAYWLNEFSTVSPQLFHLQKKSDHNIVADASTLYLDATLSDKLQIFADSHKVSLYQLVLSTLVTYFGKRSGHDNITIGMPVLNRSRKVYRSISGVFMNLLAVKFTFDEEQSFEELLKGVKGKMREVLRHQRYQYGNLLKEIGDQSGRKHLYDIRISYESFEFTSDMEGLDTEAYAMSNMSEEDPLSIYMREYHGNGFDIRLVYNKSYFSGEEIEAIKRHLLHLFTSLPEASSQKLTDISVMTEGELRSLLEVGKGPVEDWPATPFHQQWEKVIAEHGELMAVSDVLGSLTYHELNSYSLSLLAKLQGEGLKPGNRIGIMPSRDRDLPASLLACLLGGFTYVPLDPEYPVSRLEYMWEDSGCKILLKSPSVSSPFKGNIKVVSIESLSASPQGNIPDISNELPSYIIYTSGSTGKPKGVLISISSLLDYVWTFLNYFALDASDKIVQQSAISFDTSVEEIFPILFSGGELHILEDRRDLDALSRLIEEKNISILSTNPQAINYLARTSACSSLRILISGGDILKPEYLNGYSDSVRIFNTYGPTESTVCASYQEVRPGQKNIPIGKAIANRELIILDDNGRIVPFNTPGELHIGGRGLALEYLNLPEATSQKFIKHPWAAGERLYRTGDRARIANDGTIEFLGRIDEQLSLRGYRIEAKEVELAIRQTGLVSDLIIDVKELAGVPVLGCWYISNGGKTQSNGQWQEILEEKLPAYMIPAAWIHLEKFPLLPNGKVDKKSLEVPVANKEEVQNAHHAPATQEELAIADIWQSILQKDITSTKLSFFQIGGHSLTALQLLNKLKATFGCDLAYKDIFNNPTIASQATLIKGSTPAN